MSAASKACQQSTPNYTFVTPNYSGKKKVRGHTDCMSASRLNPGAPLAECRLRDVPTNVRPDGDASY